jgi:hypothetical protein
LVIPPVRCAAVPECSLGEIRPRRPSRGPSSLSTAVTAISYWPKLCSNWPQSPPVITLAGSNRITLSDCAKVDASNRRQRSHVFSNVRNHVRNQRRLNWLQLVRKGRKAVEETESSPIATARYVLLGVATAITGYSVKAMQRKIERGDWAEGKVWLRAPDGRILLSIEGFEKWVEGL